MFVALSREAAIASPTVGAFVASVAPGTVLSPNLVLGTIARAGRVDAVHAAADARGRVAKVTVPRGWVEYGTTLFELGTVDEVSTETVANDASGRADGGVAVRAETDGTVYLSPDPQSPPFVVVGQRVEARATLALVEVMKTFTPVRAPMAGIIDAVVVKTGASVTSGEPMFWLRPIA